MPHSFELRAAMQQPGPGGTSLSVATIAAMLTRGHQFDTCGSDEVYIHIDPAVYHFIGKFHLSAGSMAPLVIACCSIMSPIPVRTSLSRKAVMGTRPN